MKTEEIKELLCLSGLDILQGKISDQQLVAFAKMIVIESKRRELLSKL